MKLFHAPGACSLGIRVLLEEIGAPHEVVGVDLRAGGQRTPDYLAMNPKGKVPALLRDDGSVLTEFPAIALWLARTYPEAALWPTGIEEEARAMELLDYLVSTVHMRGFTLVLVPQKFVPGDEAQAALRAHGRAVATEGLAQVAQRLGEKPFLNGERPGVTDAALFYILRWAAGAGVTVPDALQAFDDRMMARAPVRRALDLPAA
jgi:glutathione S-transferase